MDSLAEMKVGTLTEIDDRLKNRIPAIATK